MTFYSTNVRRTVALVLASLLASLSGCGGFTAVDVGGTISGLTGTGLVLNNGTDVVKPAVGATTFVFPTQVAIRAPYLVTIATQPARQGCILFNAAGIAGASPVTIVQVTCTPTTYTVGGTISNVMGSSLVLTNGSDQIAVPAGSTSFTFPTQVADGSPYGVTVLSQPNAAQTCLVANGSAVVNGAAVTSVQVTCK